MRRSAQGFRSPAGVAAALLLAACSGRIDPSGGACCDAGGGAASSGGSTGGGASGGASPGSSGGTSSGGSSGSSSGAPDGGGSSGSPIVVGHPGRVLLCDEGNRRVLLVDLRTAAKAVWSTPLDGPRDLQLVGGGRVAVSTATGYVELDLETGEIRRQVGGHAGVETLRRLPDGHTILGANAGGGVTLQELDAQDAPVPGRRVTFTRYGQLRLLRRTAGGTFLVGVGTKLAEVAWSGETLWDMDIPDGSSVYQGLRRADGTLAVASGYGAAVLIVDPATRSVRATLGGKAQPDAASVLPNFFAGFQILPNDHVVVTNWEGHGGGNGGKGLQLLEYDASGALVWSWKQDAALVSSLDGVIVLDGLDTTRLHDDVDGVLAPVTR